MLISENVPSVHETRLYKSRTDLSQSKNQHHRCVANFSEIVKGFWMFHNKYAPVGNGACHLRAQRTCQGGAIFAELMSLRQKNKSKKAER